VGVVARFRSRFRGGHTQQQMVRTRANDMLRLGTVALTDLDRIQADVGGDAIEPGSKRNRAPEGMPPLPRASQGVLHGVLSLVDRAQHPVAVDEELVLMAGHLVPESLGRIQEHLAKHCAPRVS
jgi:hypothetical protein